MKLKNTLVLLGLIVCAIALIACPALLPALFLTSLAPFKGLMAITALADRFKEIPCQVVIGNNYDTCGTVTRATVSHLTPEQLDELFRPDGLYADMDAWWRTAFEMQACGVKTNGVYDWLMSSAKNLKHLVSTQKMDRGPSLLMPFVLARQDSVVNVDFWAITAGQANSAYTATVTGPLTAPQLALGVAADRVIRVVSRYGVNLEASWFVDRDRVIIFGRSGNGQQTQGQWKVLASAAEATGAYVDVLVTSQNSGSSTPYNTAPTSGVLIKTGAFANDFESWCHNRPTLDPRKRVPFWIETVRRSRCVDSEYKKVYARLMESNEAWRQFGDLPLSERNRQDEQQFQNEQVNAFFWGKAVSSNQTMALWQNLRQILTVTGDVIDPGTGGKLVAYEAYQVGVMEQLRACDRVRDLQNNPLNLYEFFDEIYNIVRARKSQGKSADSIDVYTDSRMAALFETAFVNYMKTEYGDIVRLNIDTGKNTLGFHWTSFEPKFPQGVTINIITHEYFDDWFNAFSAESIGSSGRMMLILDIGMPGPKGGTIYPGMIESNRKNHTLGELQNLARIDQTFACTMENVTQEIILTSVTKTAVVECPANSLAIVGIADTVPTTTGKSLNPTYANLY
jgi:hypothetical protein